MCLPILRIKDAMMDGKLVAWQFHCWRQHISVTILHNAMYVQLLTSIIEIGFISLSIREEKRIKASLALSYCLLVLEIDDAVEINFQRKKCRLKMLFFFLKISFLSLSNSIIEFEYCRKILPPWIVSWSIGLLCWLSWIVDLNWLGFAGNS